MPPPIAAGTAQAGVVPIPNTASAGPAQPPIAAPAVAKGTVAAIPTPPVASPTPEPKTPPAMPPTVAPAALIAAVLDVPAAMIPATDVAVPPTTDVPMATFFASPFFVLCPPGRASPPLSSMLICASDSRLFCLLKLIHRLSAFWYLTVARLSRSNHGFRRMADRFQPERNASRPNVMAMFFRAHPKTWLHAGRNRRHSRLGIHWRRSLHRARFPLCRLSVFTRFDVPMIR